MRATLAPMHQWKGKRQTSKQSMACTSGTNELQVKSLLQETSQGDKRGIMNATGSLLRSHRSDLWQVNAIIMSADVTSCWYYISGRPLLEGNTNGQTPTPFYSASNSYTGPVDQSACSHSRQETKQARDNHGGGVCGKGAKLQDYLWSLLVPTNRKPTTTESRT